MIFINTYVKDIKGVQMKKIFIVVLALFFINFPILYCDASTEETIQEQQSEFQIQDFIKNAKQYSGEFFENINIEDVLNDAIKGEVDNSTFLKKILNLIGGEITSGIKAVVSILAIILIHTILKSISESLENNNISKLIYYVQYILIVTLIMSNFTEIIKLVKETASNLVGFINVLIPLLLTLMVYTGNVATSTLIEPIILFICNFTGNIIADVLIPIVLVIVVFLIISKVSEKIQIEKMAKFLKSGVIWFLGIFLTIFVD